MPKRHQGDNMTPEELKAHTDKAVEEAIAKLQAKPVSLQDLSEDERNAVWKQFEEIEAKKARDKFLTDLNTEMITRQNEKKVIEERQAKENLYHEAVKHCANLFFKNDKTEEGNK